MLFFISALGFLIFFLDARIDYLINADNSSELLLGRLLATENKIISTNWLYSTELRVLNTQLFYAFFFKFFHNWHNVRVYSYTCMYIIMVFSCYLLCKNSKSFKYALLFSTLLLLPFSEEYYRIILKGAFYIPHIIIAFLSIALIEEFTVEQSKFKTLIILSEGIILSFLAGLGGPRQIIITYLPLILSSIFIILSDIDRSTFTGPQILEYINRNIRYPLYSMIMLIMSAIGYFINSKILSKTYSFSSWNNIKYTKLEIDNVLKVVNGIFVSFGYTEENIFSIATLYNLVCFLWIALTASAIIYAVKNRHSINKSFFRFSVFIVTTYMLHFILYSFTDMNYADRYCLPVVLLSIPLLAMFAEHIKLSSKYVKTAIILFIFLVVLNSMCIYYLKFHQDDTRELRMITSVLNGYGYKDGYATYWNSTVLTELSDGEINVWNWGNTTEDFNSLAHWLQLTDHLTNPPDSKVFLLFTIDEYQQPGEWKKNLASDKIIYQSDSYIIFGYENYLEIHMN